MANVGPIVLGVLLLLALPAFAVPPEVADAADWLEAQANPLGGFGSEGDGGFLGSTEVRDTSAVLRLLERVNPTSARIQEARVRLEMHPPTPQSEGTVVPLTFDEVSRRAVARGGFAGAELERLALGQSATVQDETWQDYPGGGWGIQEGYSSNALDTALVLHAIGQFIGFVQREVLIEAGERAHLRLVVPQGATELRVRARSIVGQTGLAVRLAQGWEVPPDSAPQTFDYMIGVLRAPGVLGALPSGEASLRYDAHPFFSSQFSLAVTFSTSEIASERVEQAYSFLEACQGAEGGFSLRPGGEPDLFVTLVVLDALLAADHRLASDVILRAVDYVTSRQLEGGAIGGGQPDLILTALAVTVLKRVGASAGSVSQAESYLRAQQGGDGSWSGSVYATALAAEALLGPVNLSDDNDPVPAYLDNCSEASNPTQIDSDGDGFGNACDADLDGSGIVNFADLAIFRGRFLSSDPHADLTGDGLVNFADLARFRALIFRPPGPARVDGRLVVVP